MYEQVSSSNPAFNWRQARAGLTVTLINMHGDADIFTTHESHFEFSEDGRAKAAQLLAILEHLNHAVGHDPEASFEAICARVQKATGFSQEDIESRLDGLVVSDSDYDEYSATPVAYTLAETDPSGRVMRAQFDNDNTKKKKLVGYKAIGSVHSSYLRTWE